ncbi:MAG: type II secretion system protein GspM [Gemmatimonadaceae bacterium]
MFGRPIEPRERRTLVVAALVSVAALLAAYAVVPYARRWTAREESIASKREQLARLHWLARSEARLTRTAEERERTLDAAPRRLIVGESASLATAELQRAVQEMAEASQLQVQQLDVAGANADAPSDAAHVGARLSAVGDVIGLAALLERITRGAPFAELQELDVQPNPLRGDLLTINVAIRAPWVQP